MQAKKIKHAENLHQKIGEKIAFFSGANSTKKLIENKGFNQNKNIILPPISMEFAPLFKNTIIKHLDNLVKIDS